MPQSRDRGQPRALPPSGVAQIATSNHTLNSFLGGSRPSWMTDGNSANSSITVNTAAGQSCRPSSVRKRGRSRKDGTSQSTAISQNPTPLRQNSNPVDQFPAQPVNTEPSHRVHTILPSPAPTDEPSPAVSAGNESPSQKNASNVEGPAQEGETVMPGYPNETEGIAAQDAASSFDQLGRNVSQSANPDLSRQAAMTESQIPPAASVAISRQDASHETNLSPRTEQNPRPLLHQPNQRQELDTGAAQVSGEATSNITGRPSKRPRVERPAHPTNLYGGPSLLEHYRQIIATQILQYERINSLNVHYERPRYKFLEQAFERNDAFYFILHQLLCLWSIDRDTVYQTLGTSTRVTPEDLDSAFEIMQCVLRRNDSMDAVHLRWFAQFPEPITDMLNRNPTYNLAVSDIARFLLELPKNWSGLIRHTEARQYPLLACEMIVTLKCMSPLLQKMLFTLSRRHLGIPDGNISTELNNVFHKDQDFELRVLHGRVPPQDIGRVRQDFVERYLHIVRSSRRPSPGQVPNASSSSGQPAPTSQYPPRLPSQPFPGSQHPASPSINQGFPSGMAGQPGAALLRSQTGSQTVSSPVIPSQYVPSNNQQIQHRQSVGHMNVQPGHQISYPSQHLSMNPQSPQFTAMNRTTPHTQHLYTSQTYPSPGVAPSRNPTPIQQRRASANQTMRQHMPGTQGAIQPGMPDPGAQYQSQVLNPGQTQVVSPAQTGPSVLSHPWAVHNPMASASGQPRPTAAGSVGQPMQGALRPQPPLLAPFNRIRENEFPISPYDPTSVEIGLHQAELRSPRRVPLDLPNGQYYQYIRNFATPPKQITPRMGLRALAFNISEEAASKVALEYPRSMFPGLSVCKFSEGSLRYRLRLCVRPDRDSGVTESQWVVSPSHWPEYIIIDFNGIPMNLRRKQHHHKDLPLELTKGLKLGENLARISLPAIPQNTMRGHRYFVAIEVVETRSHDSLLAMINKLQHFSTDETKQEIRRRLRGSDSDDMVIENQTLTISLADPFSSAMFTSPVRGVHCKHLECFDLETWLQTRPRKPKQRREGGPFGEEPCMVDVWKCPICGLDARPTSLRIDDFLVEVRNALLAEDQTWVKTITINADCEWNPVEVAPDPDDSDEDEASGPRHGSMSSAAQGTRAAPAIPVIEILDD